MAGIDPASDASPPDTSDPRHRAVRSFVLRQGRMTAAQARAFEEHWQRYGLVAGDAPLDLDVILVPSMGYRSTTDSHLRHAEAMKSRGGPLGIPHHATTTPNATTAQVYHRPE